MKSKKRYSHNFEGFPEGDVTIVDADSQFTAPVTLPVRIPAPERNVEDLVRSGCLPFGHWQLGIHHSNYVVLLLNMPQDVTDRVCEDATIKAKHEFTGFDPTLVICPSESTAIYRVQDIAKAFAREERVVFASPAFRKSGRHELRLEIPPDDLELLARRSQCDILFFDDSRSSGETERRAMLFVEKVLQEVQEIRWFTYVVLSRRRYQRASQWPMSVPHDRTRKYAFESFASIGSESFTGLFCPLCRAASRAREASRWAKGARPGIRLQLRTLEARLTAALIERPRQEEPLLTDQVSLTLLQLLGMPIVEACTYINASANATPDERQAFGLYCALLYDDIGGYIAPDRYLDILIDFARNTTAHEPWGAVAFLFASALIPTSVLCRALPKIVALTTSHAQPDMTGALAAIAFASHAGAIPVNATVQVHSPVGSETLSVRRARELHEEIIATVAAVSPHQSEDAMLRELMLADLLTLSHEPEPHNAGWVARMLASLLHPGSHQSFLYEQVSNLSSSNAPSVRDGLLQAVSLLRKLPPMVTAHLQSQLDHCDKELHVCKMDDLDRLRNVADTVLDVIWRTYVLDRFFWFPSEIHRRVKNAILYARHCKDLSHVMFASRNFVIVPPSESLTGVPLFGPGFDVIDDHLRNLIINAATHLPLEQHDRTGERLPIVFAFFDSPSADDRIPLVVAARSKHVATERLFLQNNGLSTARACFQLFGGDVVYSAKESLPAECMKFFPPDSDIHSIETLYKHRFTTYFPKCAKVM